MLIGEQLLAAGALIEEIDGELVDDYVDIGIARGLVSGPGFDRLLADAKLGKLDVVALSDAGRLARDNSDFHFLRTKLLLCDCDLLFPGVRDSPLCTLHWGENQPMSRSQ